MQPPAKRERFPPLDAEELPRHRRHVGQGFERLKASSLALLLPPAAHARSTEFRSRAADFKPCIGATWLPWLRSSFNAATPVLRRPFLAPGVLATNQILPESLHLCRRFDDLHSIFVASPWQKSPVVLQ